MSSSTKMTVIVDFLTVVLLLVLASSQGGGGKPKTSGMLFLVELSKSESSNTSETVRKTNFPGSGLRVNQTINKTFESLYGSGV